MNDSDKIQFGVYKGTALANVPADYLLWLFDNQKCYGQLKEYIIENKEVLVKEAANKNKFLSK